VPNGYELLSGQFNDLTLKFHACATSSLNNVFHSTLKKMKNLKYVFAFVIAILAMSCTEENITPQKGQDDPIGVPPPPPPPKP
jgi:hypothetical protein